jgi:hypothetical protein
MVSLKGRAEVHGPKRMTQDNPQHDLKMIISPYHKAQFAPSRTILKFKDATSPE